jgi:hypothetical protein
VTPLVAIIVIVLVGVLAANVISRARSGVRSVRSHHRALDTLGHITTTRPVAAQRGALAIGALSTPDAPRQAHIRIRPTVVEEVEVEEEPIPEPVVEIEEPAPPVPVGSRFHLAPAPDNDLWDTVAIRELVDGPGEPEETDPSERPDADNIDLEGTSDLPGGDEDGDSDEDGDDALRLDGGISADDVTGPYPMAASHQPEQEPAWSGGVSADAGAAGDDQLIGAGWGGPHFGTKGAAAVGPGAGWPRAGRRTAGSAAVGPGRPRRRNWPLRGTRRVVATTTVLALCIVTVAVVLSNRHHATPAAAATPQVGTASPALRPLSPRLIKPKRVTKTVSVRLVSEEPGSLHYHLAGGARVTLKANGPCWVEIRRTDANGQEIYLATMAAGATESVRAPAWVRLGRPGAVAVIVGGATVTAPVVGGQPYDLLFD